MVLGTGRFNDTLSEGHTRGATSMDPTDVAPEHIAHPAGVATQKCVVPSPAKLAGPRPTVRTLGESSPRRHPPRPSPLGPTLPRPSAGMTRGPAHDVHNALLLPPGAATPKSVGLTPPNVGSTTARVGPVPGIVTPATPADTAADLHHDPSARRWHDGRAVPSHADALPPGELMPKSVGPVQPKLAASRPSLGMPRELSPP